MSNSGPAEAPGSTLRNVFNQIKSPTNAGGTIIKFSLIAITGYLLYSKVIKPTRAELQFLRDEEIADKVFALEQKQQRASE